jgi:hypothetical protein
MTVKYECDRCKVLSHSLRGHVDLTEDGFATHYDLCASCIAFFKDFMKPKVVA